MSWNFNRLEPQICLRSLEQILSDPDAILKQSKASFNIGVYLRFA